MPQEVGDLAPLLQSARERAGLSRRELARLLGVAVGTVVQAEKGRDLRHSTLSRYAEALPELTPETLLGHEGERSPPNSPSSWRFYRDLHGFVAASLTVVTRVKSSGTCEVEHRASSVRCLEGRLTEPARRLAIAQATCAGSSAAVRSLVERDLSLGDVAFDDGGDTHEMRFDDGDGFDYAFRSSLPALAGSASLERGTVPFDEGVRVEIRYPVERLLLEVTFESGEAPEDAALYSWPRTILPATRFALHGGGVEVERGERTLSCDVALPLVGFCHGLGWQATPA